jgi:ElaB protein
MESALESPTARKVGDFANGQVSNFLDTVEDLTKALKDIETPDIVRVRAKVKIALAAAKSAASDTAQQLSAQARAVGQRTDGYVRDNPWQVIGIAAVVGLAVGIFASRR